MEENVYRFFKEICCIPRETYHIEKISNYLVDFAKERNLEVIQDDAFNVIIKKNASTGYENVNPIILQTHMDMVCQKTSDSSHDFEKDGIDIIEDNGFLRADGTTLGADDGIGMAMVLAILDGDYPHPKIEALFTVNEEVGMDGAYAIDMSNFDGNRLINLDSEEEGILTAGCAGGVQLEAVLQGNIIEKTGSVLSIHLSGLMGGHSGVDIDKGRVNAIVFLMREMDSYHYHFISIDGGRVDNAIADQCTLKILIEDEFNISSIEKQFISKLKELGEENAVVKIESNIETISVFDDSTSSKIKNYFKEIPNGVLSYEENLKDKVSTSLNLGIIRTDDCSITVRHLIRSSSMKEKEKLIHRMNHLGEENSFIIREVNSFPVWEYQKESYLRDYLQNQYQEMFQKNLEIDVTHAGLECGILASKKEKLDCVSIGPNVVNAHTPKERVEIESVNRMYEFLLSLLKNML